MQPKMAVGGPKLAMGAFPGMAPQPRPQQQPLPKMSTPVLGSNSPNSPSRMPRAGPFSAPQQPQPAAASQAAAAAKPNYFVGVGAGANLNLNATPNPAAAGTNIAPKVKADLFANLLGDAGAKLGSGPGAAGFGAANAPKTIKDLVHAKEAKLMDPDEFKVHYCLLHRSNLFLFVFEYEYMLWITFWLEAKCRVSRL